jgi:hypothetical protein
MSVVKDALRNGFSLDIYIYIYIYIYRPKQRTAGFVEMVVNKRENFLHVSCEHVNLSVKST